MEDYLKDFKETEFTVGGAYPTRENPSIVGITIDNGGSELRAILNDSVPRQDGATLPLWLTPNKIYKIQESSFRSNKEVSNPGSIIRVIEAPADYLHGMFGTGPSAQVFSTSSLKLDNLKSKTDSDEYYNQFVYAISQVLYCGFNGLAPYAVDISGRTRLMAGIERGMLPRSANGNEGFVTVSLVTVIPLQEHSGKEDKSALLKDTLCGSYTIEFPMVKDGVSVIHFTILPENTKVAPEGGVCVIKLGRAIKPDDYTMVVDIGDVSDDIAIFEGKDLIKYDSTKNAGSTLIAELMAQLKDQGYNANTEVAKNAITSGMITKNGVDIDVSDIVEEARRVFITDNVKPDLIRVISRARVIPQQLTRLIVVGRLMDDDNKFKPIPDYIVEMLDIEGVEVVYPYKVGRLSNLMSADAVNTSLTGRLKSQHDC